MTFTEWEAGVLTDTQTARALAMELGEVEDELRPLEAQRTRLRDELSRVVAHAGGKMDVPGFGQLAMTAPALTNSYDAKRLDEIVTRLFAAGYNSIAEEIYQCRKQSARAGALRIVRERHE